MQCNQPPFCTGFQNNTQFFPFYPQVHYPNVIGEGDVISYALPDGNLQCYFVPISRHERWIPNCAYPYYMPNSLPINYKNEAWFVRSVVNTYPAAGLDQISNNYANTFSRSNTNIQTYNFIQKFHNDSCTSTTDLHYFFPCLRNECAKGCAAIQVEISNKEKSIFHYETVCNRPCYCNMTNITKTEPNRLESDCHQTPMCVDVDETISTHSCCNNSKKEKSRCSTKNHSCACLTSHVKLNTADKVVTTCADQAISCTDMKMKTVKGDYTQTGKRKTSERTDIETEIWYPRGRKSKKNKAKYSNNATPCNSACCLGSACSACIDSEQYGNT